MVGKKYTYNEKNMPPPMNESWWEAVLAEDEAQHNQSNTKHISHGGGERKFSELDNEEFEESLDWEEAKLLYEQDQVISLMVTGCNRGGLLVRGDGLHGFVPL